MGLNVLRSIKTFSDLPIGTKIEMTVVDPEDGKLDILFVSQIEGFGEANIMRISAPIYEAKVFPVRVNSHLEAYLFLNQSIIYAVSGVVVDRSNNDGFAILEVNVTKDIKKIQRRQYFRFDCSVPVLFFQPDTGDPDEMEEIIGKTIDISGGGLSALTENMLESNAILKGYLELDDIRVGFSGKILRCIRYNKSDEVKYLSSVSFTDIEYKDREKIVGFIFNRQRELLKRGLRGSK